MLNKLKSLLGASKENVDITVNGVSDTCVADEYIDNLFLVTPVLCNNVNLAVNYLSLKDVCTPVNYVDTVHVPDIQIELDRMNRHVYDTIRTITTYLYIYDTKIKFNDVYDFLAKEPLNYSGLDAEYGKYAKAFAEAMIHQYNKHYENFYNKDLTVKDRNNIHYWYSEAVNRWRTTSSENIFEANNNYFLHRIHLLPDFPYMLSRKSGRIVKMFKQAPNHPNHLGGRYIFKYILNRDAIDPEEVFKSE